MSVFQSLDKFEAVDKTYELLPFKFGRIQDRVILTNFAGEHYLCQDSIFKDFIEQRLTEKVSITTVALGISQLINKLR